MRSEPAVAPGRLPLLGHVPSMLRRPLRFLSVAGRSGPVTTVYLGRTPAYLINDPDLVRRMLVGNVADFDKGVQYDKLKALLGNGLSTAAGTAHRDRRRLMQPAFHHDRIDGYTALIRETAVAATRDWRPGAVINVADEMRKLSLNIVARAFCSTELDNAAVDAIQRDLPTVMRGITWRALSPVAALERLPLPYNRRFQAANLRLRAAIDDLIEQYDGTAGDDLLSLLLPTTPPTPAQADPTKPGLPRDAIRDELVNLLFAGTETTGNALCWLWHVLATHPDVEAEVVREAEAGEHAYTARVVKEALRLYPPPWLITRRVRKDTHLGDYDLVKGATVLFSPYAIQRDPALYPDPERFDPDRWLPGAESTARNAYLPFGAGPHKCIGEGFALLEMTIAAGEIARRFRLVPTEPVKPKASATLVPTRFLARLEQRGHDGLSSPISIPGGAMATAVEISERFVLDAPIDFTYEFLTDLRNDRKWYPAVREIRVVKSDDAATTYEQDLAMLGIRYSSRIELARTEPPHRAELRTVESKIPFVCTYTLEDVTPSQTTLTVTASVVPAGPFRLLGPLFRVLLLRRVRGHFARLPGVLAREHQDSGSAG